MNLGDVLMRQVLHADAVDHVGMGQDVVERAVPARRLLAASVRGPADVQECERLRDGLRGWRVRW